MDLGGCPRYPALMGMGTHVCVHTLESRNDVETTVRLFQV